MTMIHNHYEHDSFPDAQQGHRHAETPAKGRTYVVNRVAIVTTLTALGPREL